MVLGAAGEGPRGRCARPSFDRAVRIGPKAYFEAAAHYRNTVVKIAGGYCFTFRNFVTSPRALDKIRSARRSLAWRWRALWTIHPERAGKRFDYLSFVKGTKDEILAWACRSGVDFPR